MDKGAGGIIESMAGGRASDPSISAYLAHRIDEETKKGVTLSELAVRAGLTTAHVSTIRSGNRGVGWKSIQGLAQAFGLSLAELETEAQRYAASKPPARAPETRIEREDRYPERAKAIKAAEALGIRPDAISNVAGTHWKSAESRDARWWLAQIQGESDRLDAFDDNPALREQEREQSARDTAELVRQEQEMLRERNEKYFGKKPKK